MVSMVSLHQACMHPATMGTGSISERACLVPLADVPLSSPIYSSVQGGAAVPGKPAPTKGTPLQPCKGTMCQVSRATLCPGHHARVSTSLQTSLVWPPTCRKLQHCYLQPLLPRPQDAAAALARRRQHLAVQQNASAPGLARSLYIIHAFCAGRWLSQPCLCALG